MRHLADSFAWPFRGRWRQTWAIGLVAVLFLPLLFLPLLGYAIAATRAAQRDPSLGPPPWRLSLRLFYDGSWATLLIAVTLAPFAVAWVPITTALANSDSPIPYVVAFFVLALLWGLVVLLLVPQATAAFAATGDFHRLFDVAASIGGVKRDFATWNAVVAAIVTAWAIGVAGVGLLCVGLIPGVFYAILVSAHAAAALRPTSSAPTSRPGPSGAAR